MHIFGYQIRTVNMDRCHGSQISRALNFLGLGELVNEKNQLAPGEFRLISADFANVFISYVASFGKLVGLCFWFICVLLIKNQLDVVFLIQQCFFCFGNR